MARNHWVQIGGVRVRGFTLAGARRVAQRAANELRQAVRVGYDDVAAPRARAKRMKRNPVMQGYDFTGEEWVIRGLGPNGRRATAYATSKREAEQTADYLHDNYGIRAITVRRTRAPGR